MKTIYIYYVYVLIRIARASFLRILIKNIKIIASLKQFYTRRIKWNSWEKGSVIKIFHILSSWKVLYK